MQSKNDPSQALDTSAELRNVIRHEALSIVFQPIVDLGSATIAGYEALSRPTSDCAFPHPGALFEAAEESDYLFEIEQLARRKTIEGAADWPVETMLFLNNSPRVLTDAHYIEALAEDIRPTVGMDMGRIVLEVTERTGGNVMELLPKRTRELRDLGFQIAIDDVGAGFSGLTQITSLRPNWIKLDRDLISSIDTDPLKQNLIRFFVKFTRFGNMRLIAEGIERHEELMALIELGVTHGQGFYLARPAAEPPTLSPELVENILDIQHQVRARTFEDAGTVRVGSIATSIGVHDRTESCAAVWESISRSVPPPDGLVLTDGRRYVGWVTRSVIESNCESNDPVGNLSITASPIVGDDTTLSEALDVVSAQPQSIQVSPLIVQKHGNVSGVVTLSNLLQAAARTKRRTTTLVSPLTGLPSRVHADQWINEGIARNDGSHIAFIDICDFDAYNATYGTDMGDEMLRRLAGLLKGLSQQQYGSSCFTAHIGEDRFMLSSPHLSDAVLGRLFDQFSALHQEFFSMEDLGRGLYSATDASGARQTHPLTNLRIVFIESPLQRIAEPRELYELSRQLRLRNRDLPADARPAILTEQRRFISPKRKSA